MPSDKSTGVAVFEDTKKVRHLRSVPSRISTGRDLYDREQELTDILHDLGDRISALEDRESPHGSIDTQEKASPERIYRVIGSIQEESDLRILKMREILNKGLAYLNSALSSFSDELTRESQVDLFYGFIRQVMLFNSKNSNFRDALTALTVALESHVTIPYSRQEILCLKIVSELLRNNIFMTDQILEQVIDRLEGAGFDLSLPLSRIQWDE